MRKEILEIFIQGHKEFRKISGKNIITILLLLLVFVTGCAEEKKIKPSGEVIIDDLNEKFTFTEVPKRVISLAPNITEMIYVLGKDSSLIANTLYCNFPPEAVNKIKVGDLITIDFEKIISLKPDLIFITVEGNVKDSYNKLKNLGMKVLVSNPRNFEGIKKTFRDLGRIYRDSVKANNIIKNWEAEYNIILDEKQRYPLVKGMFMVSTNPIMLAGKNTFINELLTSAGMINIAEDSPLNYPMFSREKILKHNPEYILVTTDEDVNVLKSMYPEWKNITAIKKGQVKVVDADLFMRPGPRFTKALTNLFMYLHPQGN